MDPVLERRLARLKNYRTRYELAVSLGDRRYLVAYVDRKTRDGIFGAVSDDRRACKLVSLTGDHEIHFAKKVADGGRMGDWTIKFTGRTQREAYIEGELPYVGDLPDA